MTNLPTGVTQSQVQSWDQAVANLHKIATINSGLRQTVISLHGITGSDGQPLFPSGSNYVTTLEIIGKIDQVENAATVYLNSVPKDWNVSTKVKMDSYMTQITDLISELNNEGVLGIKNTNSRQQVSDIIKELSATVKIILSL